MLVKKKQNQEMKLLSLVNKPKAASHNSIGMMNVNCVSIG